jgi:hypothetical protein
VSHLPPALPLAKTDGSAHPVLDLLPVRHRTPALDEEMREGKIMARGDLEFVNLKERRNFEGWLPLLPALSICVSSFVLERRQNVKYQGI